MSQSTPVPLGLAPSFGFGDRIGRATPGHVEALHRAGGRILPVFAQQSIREMTRTDRTPEAVMRDALTGAAGAGYDGPQGADADHLKTFEDVDRTVAAGFTFFTLDPSDAVDRNAGRYDLPTLREKYGAVRDQVPWMREYRGRTVALPTGTEIVIDDEACMRCAVKYGAAIGRAVDLAGRVRRRCEEAGRAYEIELSVDETDEPTTLAEHYVIADRFRQAGVELVSLAPRYAGEFEKGVDYKGDGDALERSLEDHAALAEMLGPYKLSLHSGSDKLSIYPALARATRGRFHVKTAGTSYLEALRVVARHDERLFTQVVRFARERYEADRATYHVSATLESAPPPEAVPDVKELERLYLGDWAEVPAGQGFTGPGRQILHCTFGSALTDPALGPEIRAALGAHPDTYREMLADHFARHLAALNAGMSEGSEGVRESGSQGVRESGSEGVRESGSEGVRESESGKMENGEMSDAGERKAQGEEVKVEGTLHGDDEPVSYVDGEREMTSNATRSWETIPPYENEATPVMPGEVADPETPEEYARASSVTVEEPVTETGEGG